MTPAAQLQPTAPQPQSAQQAWQARQLRLLWDGRRLLVRATAIGLLASALVAFLYPKSYTSTAQLMPPDTQSNGTLAMVASLAAKGTGGVGSVASDLLGMKSTGALFVGILRSGASQARLVERFDMKKVYGVRLEQEACAILGDKTVVSEDRRSGIIHISVTDHSPERAAALANAYVDQLNSLISELSTSAAHRESVFLADRLKVAKRDLDDASNDLAQFSSQNSTLDLQTTGKVALDAAGNLAAELIAAQSQLEGLRQLYTDDNSRVRSLSARVAELRKQLSKMGGLKPDTADRSGRPGRIAAPGLPSDLPYPSLRTLPLLDVKYADYYRRAKIQETIFELLTEQYELSKIEEAKETPTVRVLDHPKVAEKKSSPSRMLIVFLGTFLSFFACVLLIVGADRWASFDPQDPRMVLAREVGLHLATTFKARARSLSRIGSRTGDRGQRASDQRRETPAPEQVSGD